MNKNYDRYLTLEEVQKMKQQEEQLLLDLQKKFQQSLEQQRPRVQSPVRHQQPVTLPSYVFYFKN